MISDKSCIDSLLLAINMKVATCKVCKKAIMNGEDWHWRSVTHEPIHEKCELRQSLESRRLFSNIQAEGLRQKSQMLSAPRCGAQLNF